MAKHIGDHIHFWGHCGSMYSPTKKYAIASLLIIINEMFNTVTENNRINRIDILLQQFYVPMVNEI